MPTDHRAELAKIKRFDQLVAYLRDEMGWPIARDSFEDVDDLFYDFTTAELGIDPKTAAKIESIKRLRPLSPRQPWGIFFVKFEPKRLPVVGRGPDSPDRAGRSCSVQVRAGDCRQALRAGGRIRLRTAVDPSRRTR